MRIVWSGVHERRKALNVLLRALALGHVREWTLDVLGGGPYTKRWRGLSVRLGLSSHIVWHGSIPKADTVSVVAHADIAVITSIHDLTSTVLLEFLSAGKPVVCLDHCGFADVVDGTCGIKVPIGRPKQVIAGFADAIARLEDSRLRHQLSEGAIKRSDDYTWDKKRTQLAKRYRPEWKKILVSTYACSPYRGSEPGMGWNFLREIAREHEVWAIVEKEKWEGDIRRYLAEHPDEMRSVHFHFIQKPRCRWLRKIWPPSYYWFYRVWQKRAYRFAKELHAKIGFDAVHQLNMVGFREPGYLWKLDMPFVWGPVGGLGYVGRRLLPLVGIAGFCEYLVRNVINWMQGHFMLRTRLAAKKAAATHTLVAATGENQREMKRLWGVESTIICEIGV